MDDFPVRALIIGVSIFVVMMVFSAIIIYFNTARTVADSVSNRTDIAQLYEEIMNRDNFETVISGVDIRSLIIKYARNEDVEINIVSISDVYTSQYKNINNKYIEAGGWLQYINESSSLISEVKLDMINPIWDCKVEKKVVIVDAFKETTKAILDISLDI